MIRKCCYGTTITEYGLLLGLLVVAALGAVTLLGNSLSNLNNSVSENIAKTTGGKTVAMSGKASSDKASKSSNYLWGISQAKFAEFQEELDMLSTTTSADGSEVLYFELPKAGGAGVNNTASDGNTDVLTPYAQAIKVANQLLEGAAKAKDESLKQWYLDTALQTVKLAKNQAAFEYNQDQSKWELSVFAGATLSEVAAASSMKGWVSHLYGQQEQLEALRSQVSQSEFQIAKGLVESVAKGTENYYQLQDNSISGQVFYDPQIWDVRQEAKKAMTAGVASSGAMDSTLMGSINMMDRADAQP